MENFWLGFEKRAGEDKKPSLAQWVGRGAGKVMSAVDSQKVIPKDTLQKVRQKADKAVSFAKQKQREFSKGVGEGKKGDK